MKNFGTILAIFGINLTSVYPETTSEKNTLLFKFVKLKTGEFNLLWKLKKNNFYSFS